MSEVHHVPLSLPALHSLGTAVPARNLGELCNEMYRHGYHISRDRINELGVDLSTFGHRDLVRPSSWSSSPAVRRGTPGDLELYDNKLSNISQLVLWINTIIFLSGNGSL